MEKVHYRKFTRDEFDAGVWGQMRRVALDQNGQVMGIHHPDDTNKWEDGSDVDWTVYENNVWNCMVQIPKFYYRVMRGDHIGYDTYRCEISSTPESGYKLHPAFEREDGVIENYQYMSAFEGWIDAAGRLRSLPNKDVIHSKTIIQYREAALKNGDCFSQQDFYLTSAVQMLYLVEYGGFDAQRLLAVGANGNSKYLPTGKSIVSGNKSGGNDIFMSYRGIENFYGNYLKYMDGINMNSRIAYVAKKNFESNKFSDQYIKVCELPVTGYIKKFHNLEGYFDFAFLASDVKGNENSYVTDYLFTNASGHYVVTHGSAVQVSLNGCFGFNSIRTIHDATKEYAARLQYI